MRYKGCKLFFHPAPGGKSRTVTTAKLVQKWAGVYVPECDAPTPTLLRKPYTTEAESPDNSAQAGRMLADTHGHSFATAQKQHNRRDPAAHAKRCGAVHRKFFGGHVDWPEDAEVKRRAWPGSRNTSTCDEGGAEDVA